MTRGDVADIESCPRAIFFPDIIAHCRLNIAAYIKEDTISVFCISSLVRMSNNSNSITIDNGENSVSNRVKFFVLLLLQIPSILLCLSIFVFFLTHRALLRISQNHALQLLIVVNFIQVTCDLPMVIHYYQLGRISPATPGYCTWWTFLEWTLNATSELLMVTISLQRHIFIFHAHLFRVRLYRVLLHALPLIFCIIYPLVFYLAVIVFYPCDGTQWDYSTILCGLADCYLVYSKVLGTYDWGVNNGLPMLIIAISDAAVIVRVILEKRRRHQPVTWQKHRRMTLQLLAISSLYFVAWSPSMLVAVLQQLYTPTFLADVQVEYFVDMTYLVCLLLPWVCLGLFPEFKKWILRHPARDGIVALNAVQPQ